MYSAGQMKSTRNDTTLHKEGVSNTSTCEMDQNFQAQLGTDNTRLMGITDCAGVLSTLNNDSKANGSTCRDGFFHGAGELDFSGNTNINSKGSSELTGTSPGQFRFPVVSGP